MKSARDPIVGPPDRPGSRVHCPAPVLTTSNSREIGEVRKIRRKDFMINGQDMDPFFNKSDESRI